MLYRLTNRATNRAKKLLVIQKKFKLLWLIPIWLDTDYYGFNAVEMNKLVNRLNRGTR